MNRTPGRRQMEAITMNTLHDYNINPSMGDDMVIIRIARKEHHCSGGHNGRERTICLAPIYPCAVYVEYLGESPAYSSGQRYHVDCALEQGLLVPKSSEVINA